MSRKVLYNRDGSRSYFIDGKKVSRAVFSRRKPRGKPGAPNISKAYNRPLVSQSLGCPPAQVAEFRELIRASGNHGAFVRDDGKIEFSSRAARRKELERSGLVDRDGGYSD